MFDDQISRIQSKLEMVRKFEPTKIHKYTLNTPADFSLVEAYQQKYNVMLPDAYIKFVTRMGNGGAGPGHGIDVLNLDLLPGYTLKELQKSYAASSILDPTSKFELPPKRKIRKNIYNGLKAISDTGCGGYNYMIVNGEYRGRIVCIEASFIVRPSFYDGNNFLDWYEAWISGVADGSIPP